MSLIPSSRKLLQNPYPYDFPTSGFAMIDSIRAEIDDQSDWDFSANAAHSRTIQYQAAKRFGILVPFSPDELALSRYLIAKQAGLNISTYAWGLYFEKSSKAESGTNRVA